MPQAADLPNVARSLEELIEVPESMRSYIPIFALPLLDQAILGLRTVAVSIGRFKERHGFKG